MQIKHNKPNIWNPWGSIQRRSVRHITGITLVLFSFIPFCLPAHAIGPYTVKNDTIIDQGTSLEWQKTDNGMQSTWQNALAYCEGLSLDSKNDWRLPNIRELKSLVDYSKYYPAIDPAIPCQSSSYWSATSVADFDPKSAWSVFFGNGDDIWKDKTKIYHVRCVRGGLSGK